MGGYEPLQTKGLKVIRLPYHTPTRLRYDALTVHGQGGPPRIDQLPIIQGRTASSATTKTVSMTCRDGTTAGHGGVEKLDVYSAYIKLHTCEPRLDE